MGLANSETWCVHTVDSEASTIEIIYGGRPTGVGLPRSFASSMLERCDNVVDNRGSLLVSGFRRDEVAPLTTTEKEVLRQDVVPQSDLSVPERPVKQEFSSGQVVRKAYIHLIACNRNRAWWSAVRALDTRPKGPQFKSQPVHYQVTTLGKLFTPTCLCRCKYIVVGVDS